MFISDSVSLVGVALGGLGVGVSARSTGVADGATGMAGVSGIPVLHAANNNIERQDNAPKVKACFNFILPTSLCVQASHTKTCPMQERAGRHESSAAYRLMKFWRETPALIACGSPIAY
jgi:hypothetical protein